MFSGFSGFFTVFVLLERFVVRPTGISVAVADRAFRALLFGPVGIRPLRRCAVRTAMSWMSVRRSARGVWRCAVGRSTMSVWRCAVSMRCARFVRPAMLGALRRSPVSTALRRSPLA